MCRCREPIGIEQHIDEAAPMLKAGWLDHFPELMLWAQVWEPLLQPGLELVLESARESGCGAGDRQ